MRRALPDAKRPSTLARATAGGARSAGPGNDIGRPALAVISRRLEGGGVAYVGRLLEHALASGASHPPSVISLDQHHAGRVSASRKLGFARQVLARTVFGATDWLLFGHPGIAAVQGLIPGAMRLPHVVQLHGTDAWEVPPSAGVRSAALRIAPSRYTRARAQHAFPEIGAIHVCAHGLLPETPPGGSLDREILDRIRPDSVLIVGRLLSTERGKGHDELLECWPLVVERAPTARLVIAGEGDDLERLRLKSRQLGVADRVMFCGYVSDATREAMLRRAALFAMPSRQEGFGLVYLEAMRAGVPCIGAVDDGASEVIVDGETGYLVPQRDRAGLAIAIARLLNDAGERARLGAAGRRRIEQHFTFDAYRRRFLRLIREHVSRLVP